MSIMDAIKESQAEKSEGFGFKTVTEYLGGHPDYLKRITGNLITKREGLVFNALFKDKFIIPYNQITSITSDTAEHLSLGRMLLVGIFAFAWKKKDKFLKITYKDHTNFEVNVVFGKLDADQWKGIVNRARQTTVSASAKTKESHE